MSHERGRWREGLCISKTSVSKALTKKKGKKRKEREKEKKERALFCFRKRKTTEISLFHLLIISGFSVEAP